MQFSGRGKLAPFGKVPATGDDEPKSTDEMLAE